MPLYEKRLSSRTEILENPRHKAALPRRQLLLGAAAVVGTTGCGYILHPERRGRSSGAIDGTVLIFDLLWLLPGLLPGAIALAVDFASGAIYGSATQINGPTISNADDPEGTLVAVELDGTVVATGRVDGQRQAVLTWSHPVDEAAVRERAKLHVRARGGAVAQGHAGELLDGSRQG